MGNYLIKENVENVENVENLGIVKIRDKKYGWKKDLPDHRDLWYTYLIRETDITKKDLRNEFMSPVYDQGNIGSCTANAILSAFSYEHKKEGLGSFDGSRLFLYYNERLIEGTPMVDSGANIRDGIKVINKIGICKEEFCPYDTTKFTIPPSINSYKDAKKHKSVKYMRMNVDINEFKNAINNNYLVIFGFSVPLSFEDSDISTTGIMKMPEEHEKIIGGHAVVACGYDDNYDNRGGYLLIKNSWSTSWGQGGYFWMPYSFIQDKYCADCWIIQLEQECKKLYKDIVINK